MVALNRISPAELVTLAIAAQQQFLDANNNNNNI